MGSLAPPALLLSPFEEATEEELGGVKARAEKRNFSAPSPSGFAVKAEPEVLETSDLLGRNQIRLNPASAQ